MSKIKYRLLASVTIALLSTFSYLQLSSSAQENNWIEPTLIQDTEKKEGPDKNRNWTDSEKIENQKQLEKILNNKYKPSPLISGEENQILDGTWSSRGPRNKPGCWQFTEVDSTDNTVWAVTCGHYGGTQFIWKGTLAGDDFNLISGRLPTRFVDIFGFSKLTGKRLITSTEDGKIYYTDNDGTNWLKPTGLEPDIQSIAVDFKNNQDIYATDGQRIFKSSNQGKDFSQIQDFFSGTDSKLYSIRYNGQPGFGNIYLARKGSIYKWNGSKFTIQGSFPWPGKTSKFSLGGDTRKLYAVSDGKYFSSIDEGKTWTSKSPSGYYYGDLSGTMSSGVKIGVNPENPEIVIGGYTSPVISKNGLSSTTHHTKGWGHYQGGTGGEGANAMIIQDQRTREMFHPDFQASQFFYNKDGKVLSIRSSDGGIFISYNEWNLSSWTGKDYNIYYNLNLFGSPSQEAYPSGLASGYKNIHDISVGTQDQGDATWYGNTDVLQNPGGDGRHKITANGKTVFSWNYLAEKVSPPYNMYDGAGNWRGTRGMAKNDILTGTKAWYFHDGAVDIGAQDNRFWILSKQLVRATWNGSNYSFLNTKKGSASDYFGALAQSNQTPDKVWTVKGPTVYKSSDRGTTWDTGTAWGGSRKADWARCGLWVSPMDDSKILVACPSGNSTVAAFSEDGGSSWSNVSGNLPNADIGGMKGEKTGRLIFASTKYGPYVFDTQTKKWSEIAGNNTPLFNGRQMEYLETHNIMRFSTWGQGIWDFKINSILESQISSSQLLSSTLQNSQSISSENKSSINVSSIAQSSTTNLDDICDSITPWQKRSYDWTASKEYVTHLDKIYSHTDWVSSISPDKNPGWTFELDCQIKISSHGLSSVMSSSSDGIVNIKKINTTKVSNFSHIGFNIFSKSSIQNLQVLLISKHGKVILNQQIQISKGLQFINWSNHIPSGSYILFVNNGLEENRHSFRIP